MPSLNEATSRDAVTDKRLTEESVIDDHTSRRSDNSGKVAAGYAAAQTAAQSAAAYLNDPEANSWVCASRFARGCASSEPQPIFKFPTTARRADGTLGRGAECRRCRDARRAGRA